MLDAKPPECRFQRFDAGELNRRRMGLDCQFPKGNVAGVTLIPPVKNRCAGVSGEPVRISAGPHQRMSIEQKSQIAPWSRNSSHSTSDRGFSQPSGRLNKPGDAPSTRALCSGSGSSRLAAELPGEHHVGAVKTVHPFTSRRLVSRDIQFGLKPITLRPYSAKRASPVNSVRSSHCACATSIRSKASR